MEANSPIQIFVDIVDFGLPAIAGQLPLFIYLNACFLRPENRKFLFETTLDYASSLCGLTNIGTLTSPTKDFLDL